MPAFWKARSRRLSKLKKLPSRSTSRMAGTSEGFYRTAAGAEIDLVLRFGGKTWAIEIKHTHAPKVRRGFHLACEDIAPTQRFIVHAGHERFPVGEGIEAIPLSLLMERLNAEHQKEA